MPSTEQARPGLVRPEYGPGAAELIRRHLGPRVVAVVAVLGVLLLVAVGVVIARSNDGLKLLEHRSAPVFTLLYPPGQLHRAAPRPGEVLRMTARRGALLMAITVRRLTLPPYRGSVAGLLPIYADRQARALAPGLPQFRALADGKARLQDAPGYQLRYRYGPPGQRTQGIDVFVVPADGDRAGVLLRYRQSNPPGGPKGAGRDLVKAVRTAFHSFGLGLDRP
jgi:hypothetical protein